MQNLSQKGKFEKNESKVKNLKYIQISSKNPAGQAALKLSVILLLLKENDLSCLPEAT